MKRSTPTEKQIESQILDWLNLQPGCFAFKVNTVGVYDPTRKIYRTNNNPHVHKGTSDIIGCYQGYFFAIEVKTPQAFKKLPGTLVGYEQAIFIGRVRMSSGQGAIVCSLDQTMEFLNSLTLLTKLNKCNK